MSFSLEIKKELCEQGPAKDCCRRAEVYGMLLFSRIFSPSEIKAHTENVEIARRYSMLVEKTFGIIPRIGGKKEGRHGGMYTLSIPDSGDCARIFSTLHQPGEELALRLNRANLENECCAGAFLRGAFLICGSVSDPDKEYHLEFLIPKRKLLQDFHNLLTELDLPAKTILRYGMGVLYLKGSGGIEDLLTMMSATKSTLNLMNIKIYKDIRNQTNRRVNCETANISKTVNAAAAQIDAIERIREAGMLESLPTELRRLAGLRAEHPEMSLRELGELCGISRSGINHRLAKLTAIGDKLKNKR